MKRLTQEIQSRGDLCIVMTCGIPSVPLLHVKGDSQLGWGAVVPDRGRKSRAAFCQKAFFYTPLGLQSLCDLLRDLRLAGEEAVVAGAM